MHWEFLRFIALSVCLETTNRESFWQNGCCCCCWWIFQYFTTGIVKLPTNHPLLSCVDDSGGDGHRKGKRTCAKARSADSESCVWVIARGEELMTYLCATDLERRDEELWEENAAEWETLFHHPPLEEEAVHLMRQQQQQQACVIDRSSKTNVSLAQQRRREINGAFYQTIIQILSNSTIPPRSSWARETFHNWSFLSSESDAACEYASWNMLSDNGGMDGWMEWGWGWANIFCVCLNPITCTALSSLVEFRGNRKERKGRVG